MSPERRRFAPILWIALLAGALLLGLVLEGVERGAETGREAPRPAAAAAGPAGDPLAGEAPLARDLVVPLEPWTSDDVGVRPGVRLAGTGRLAGRILERESGAGVGGVRVDLLPITPSATDALGTILRMARTSAGSEHSARAVAVTISEPDGGFAFTGVRRGTYFLDARGPYHVPDHLIQVRVSEAGDGGPVDAYVRRGGRVLGLARHPDGRPVVGGAVALLHGPGSAIRAFRSGELRRLDARTGRDGTFLFSGVSPGEGYEVHVLGAGFAISHAAVPPVRAGEDAAVEVVVRPGVRLEGRVLSAAAEPPGEPIPLPGAELAIAPRGLRDLQFAEELLELTHAVAGPDGRYVLLDVPPGEVQVIARAPGHLSATSEVLRLPELGIFAAPDLVLRPGPTVRGRVVDAQGRPVQGVHVRWFLAEIADPGTFDFSFASLLHQAIGDFRFPTTDEEGRFVAGPFPGEAPHHLYCAKAGFGYTRATWDPAVDGDEIEVLLSAGGAVEGIVMDAREARPVRSFLISGADRIDHDPGAPSSWNPFSGGQLVEDENGRFRVEGVLTGSSRLAFSAPGYQPRELTVTVGEGVTTKGLIVKLEPGGSVRGRVTNRAGEPVAGATVGVLGGEGWDLGRAFERVDEHVGRGRYADTTAEAVSNAALSIATRVGFLGEGAVTTDPDGRYELQGVAPGTFTVVVRHRDYALGESEPLSMPGGGALEGVDLVLSGGASLFGRIVDRFDRPLPGAILIAFSPTEFSGDSSPGAALYEGLADESGNYEIRNMAGGGYLVSSLRPDAALTPLAIASTFQLDLVNVPPDQRTRHDVVDRSAAACRVFGTVARDGRPITAGGILAISFEGDNLLGVDLKATQILADASYAFPGLAPGGYEFVVQGGDEEVRLDVLVPDLPEHRLDLELPSGRVAGRVVDDQSGAPLADCRVRLRSARQPALDGLLQMFVRTSGREARTATDEAGRFAFEGLQEGEYELSVQAPRRGALAGRYAGLQGVPVEVVEGAPAEDVELRLAPGLAVSGSVRADGAPFARAQVLAFGPGNVMAGSGGSSEDGSFVIAGLAPGEYRLVASAEGWAEAAATVALGSDPVEGVELVLSRGTELHLAVRRDGRPVPGAVAAVLHADGRPAATGLESRSRSGLAGWFEGEAVSDASGRLFVARLRAGTYRVEVRHGGSSAVLEDVAVDGEGRLELEVELE